MIKSLESDSELESRLGLKFKYHIGSDPTAPLAILVHGRAGNFNLMWTFSRCIPETWNVIAPQAPLADPIGGFSWWNIEQSDRNEIQQSRELLERFVLAAKEHFQLEPNILAGMGFSQGAGLLSLFALNNSLDFSGLALLAGFVIHSEGGQGANRPRIFMAHGSKDQAVPLAKAEQGKLFLAEAGLDVNLVTDDVAHKVGTSGMRALRMFCESLS